MRNIFVWLSGVDPQKLSYTERIKFAGFGSLILIPAILAWVSMSYAVSTITNDPLIFVISGFVWSLIVVAIDRFLISTFYKSPRNKTFNYIIPFTCRLIFAGFVGTAVSHPFILFYFDKTIRQRISEKKREAIEYIHVKADNEKANINTGSIALDVTTMTSDLKDLQNKKDELQSKKEKLQEYVQCLERLKYHEEKGDTVVGEGLCSGLTTTGKRNCRDQCINFQNRIDQINEQIKQVDLDRSDIAERINQIQKDIDSRRKTEYEERNIRRKSIEETARKEISTIEKKYSEDYLARVDALAEIERDKPHIRTVRYFMLIFFIFIDVLPVIMKFLTPVGEYEQRRYTELFKTEVEQEEERNSIIENYNDSTYQNMRRAKHIYRIKFEELIYITQFAKEFIKRLECNREEFEQKIANINDAIEKETDEERRKDYITYSTKVRAVFNDAWGKSMALFHEFLEKL